MLGPSQFKGKSHIPFVASDHEINCCSIITWTLSENRHLRSSVNPKEVSAGRLTVDPRRDADGDDKDHGVTGIGGCMHPPNMLGLTGFLGSLQKPCKSFCMTIGRLMPWCSATLELLKNPWTSDRPKSMHKSHGFSTSRECNLCASTNRIAEILGFYVSYLAARAGATPLLNSAFWLLSDPLTGIF